MTKGHLDNGIVVAKGKANDFNTLYFRTIAMACLIAMQKSKFQADIKGKVFPKGIETKKCHTCTEWGVSP